METQWKFSHYQMNPLGKIWFCCQCGFGCECFTTYSVTPQHCADRLRKSKVQEIRQSLRGHNKKSPQTNHFGA